MVQLLPLPTCSTSLCSASFRYSARWPPLAEQLSSASAWVTLEMLSQKVLPDTWAV